MADLKICIQPSQFSLQQTTVQKSIHYLYKCVETSIPRHGGPWQQAPERAFVVYSPTTEPPSTSENLQVSQGIHLMLGLDHGFVEEFIMPKVHKAILRQ